MSNVEIKPVQRNANDVAMELLELHRYHAPFNAEDIEELYVKYYAIAKVCETTSPKYLRNLISEDLLEKLDSLVK